MPAQTVIKFRRDTAANWTTTNPVLAAGEAGFETDTNKLKIGNGTSTWTSLPYTGADVSNLDFIGFDTTAGVTVTTGEMAWSADAETVAVGLDAAVSARIGQDLFIRVKNSSASVAIPIGTVVQFAGAAGDTVTVAPADADGSVEHHYIVGITAEEIAGDAFGFVTLNGVVGGLNTSAWTVGTILYADPAVAGGLTATEPSAPNLKLPLAAVVKQGSGTSGKILVRVHLGESLSDLHDVQLTSAVSGEVLQWDGAKWVNSDVAIAEVTGLQTALDGKAATSHTQNAGTIVTTVSDKAAAYTIVAADENTFIRSTSATAVTMTIANVLNIGESVQFIQFGAGQITFAADAGVTLRSVDSKLKTNKQYSVAAVTCIASGEYLVTGDLAA